MSSPPNASAFVVLSVRVEYDPRRGDADSIASALDCLLSVEGDPIEALQDYGVLEVGEFIVTSADASGGSSSAPLGVPGCPWPR